ncbi:PREDICTED: uncharacterized protein LOC108749952 [Trachymyrmex septentrionalis]|uniref:uncharacterized protein LOC108749952 n=1 Tax=Trachymyrmex septentrionalis TaxID=34720 RepID=UPI00084F0F85|nr:PREDICTED: uncharacterized protein LOC108749952 [Trachymyrmex septentrionalis]
MKLFDCIRCIKTLNQRQSSSQRQRNCETTDPLVMTKRPPTRRQRYQPHHRRFEGPQKVTPSRSNARFLTTIRSFGASWKRRGLARARSKREIRTKPRKLINNDEIKSKDVGIPKTANGIHLKRKRKIPAKSVETSNGTDDDTGRWEEVNVAGRRAGELEREYYEHLEALKFLIDPPPCFRNTETRQNFENKLNSLDFRRMNTVAIPAGPETNGHQRLEGPNRGFQSSIRENDLFDRRSYADTLDRIVEEHLKIERTMMDLFAFRAPILKSRHGEPVSPGSRENKTVRFKDEVERSGTSVERWKKGGLRPEGEGREAAGMEFDNLVRTEEISDFSRDRIPSESSNVFDVETRNGR